MPGKPAWQALESSFAGPARPFPSRTTQIALKRCSMRVLLDYSFQLTMYRFENQGPDFSRTRRHRRKQNTYLGAGSAAPR